MNELTVAEVKGQVNLIQQVLKYVMKKDVHYGTIPGCSKPTLYKAGSEQILTTFRLSIEPEIDDLSTPDEAKYRVKTRVIHIPTGNFIGMGIGCCSSNEEKYKWRKAVCDAEYEETPEDRRREKWFKGYKGSAEYKIKQVRTCVADIDNTILKMAKKRSQVDATLTTTAASDVFEQDLEDLPKEFLNTHTEPPNGKPEVSSPPVQQKKDSNGEDVETSRSGFITKKQIGRLIAIATKNGYLVEQIDDYIGEKHGLNSKSEIEWGQQYDEICKHLKIKLRRGLDE